MRRAIGLLSAGKIEDRLEIALANYTPKLTRSPKNVGDIFDQYFHLETGNDPYLLMISKTTLESLPGEFNSLITVASFSEGQNRDITKALEKAIGRPYNIRVPRIIKESGETKVARDFHFCYANPQLGLALLTGKMSPEEAQRLNELRNN
jgi:hypothetical protein